MTIQEDNDIFGSDEDLFVIELTPQQNKIGDDTKWIVPSDKVIFILNGTEILTEYKNDIEDSVYKHIVDILKRYGVRECAILVDGKLLSPKQAVTMSFEKIEKVEIKTQPILKTVADKINKECSLPNKQPSTTKNHTHDGIVGYHLKTDKHKTRVAIEAHDKAIKNND